MTGGFHPDNGPIGSLFNLKVGSLNCRGICDRAKRRNIFSLLKSSGLAIVFIQETKFSPYKHEEYGSDWHNQNIFLNSIRGGKCGVGILMNIPYIKVLKRLDDCDGRIIVLDIEINLCRLRLINTYFPSEPFLKENFICSLYPYFVSNFPVVWCGDHNITLDPSLDRLPPGSSKDYCSNMLNDLVKYYNFNDACRVIYPRKRLFTYIGPKSRSRIDKILVSPVLDVIAYDQIDIFSSDHVLIMAQICCQGTYQKPKKRWRNNCSLYAEDDFVLNFRCFWCIQSSDKKFLTNPVRWWMNTKYNFKLYSIKKGIEASTVKKRHMQMLESGLSSLNQAVLFDPDNISLHKEYDKMKKELAQKQINAVKELIFKEKANTLLFGVKPTKSFFDKYKKKIVKEPINCLKNANGIPQYDISGMLKIAEDHFSRLFKPAVLNENVVNLFLNCVTPIPALSDEQLDICRPVCIAELDEVLSQVQNHKSPGPDGLSYEFYKKLCTSTLLKYKLLDVLNNMLLRASRTGKLPAKVVEGLITLVPKKPPYDKIENYRPISLINTDLKILTKVISNRLKPYLSEILHETQYAQPSKDINMLNTLKRDILHDMDNNNDDCFFVSVDFKGAFDRVSHKFLFKVLSKLGFPETFVNLIKALYYNAASIVLVNGHQTKKIKIKSGIRQGCTLSRDLFTFSLDPLIRFLNLCDQIQKYASSCGLKTLTACFSDDVDVFTSSLSSLLSCFFFIGKYKDASGLEINLQKTKGIFFNRTNNFDFSNLPEIDWVDRLELLGIHHGSPEFIQSQWDMKVNEMKEEISFFNSCGRNTLQDKVFLSKSKLLPIFSYIAGVHPIPKKVTNSIDRLLLRFIVPHQQSTMSLYDFAAQKSDGGYGFDHISLHASLFLLRPVILYIRCRAEDKPLSQDIMFVEYFLGFRISALYGFHFNYNLPHASEPSMWYKVCYDMLVAYSVTIEECVNLRSFSKIYFRIVHEYIKKSCVQHSKLYRIHLKCFPEHLKSFNYKLHFNLLPLNLRFCEYRLDNDSRCYFCHWGPENEWHVFGRCEKLTPLWEALDEAAIIAFGRPYSFMVNRKVNGDFDLVRTTCLKELEIPIVYLNSIVNHKIYKLRNEIKYEGGTFSIHCLVDKIVRSVGGRINIEKRLPDLEKIPMLTEVYQALSFVKNLLNQYPVR